MKKNVFVFSRLAPEHLERLQCQFNVRVLEPKQGDIDAQYAAGRTTTISDAEMFEQIRLHLPEVL